MENNRSLQLNTILNLIRTCSNILLPLISFSYASRVLQPENIGKVNFSGSVVSYFSLIAGLGISTYAIRECAKVRDDREKLSGMASQIFTINICTTVVAYILLAVSILFVQELKQYRTLLIIQSAGILFVSLGADWLNTAMEDFTYITLRTVGFQLISLILTFLIVRESDDYIRYACISVFCSGGAHILNIIYRKRFCRTWVTGKVEWRRHLGPIICLFVMILSQTIFSNADITMLGMMRGDREVGLYSTAGKIERMISQIVSSIVFVLMPRLSHMFAKGDYETINTMLRRVLGFFLLIGIPCFAGATLLSEDIICIVAGEEFLDASSILRIMMLSFLFSLVGGSFLGNAILLPSGREKPFMLICCGAALFNVVMNYFFIPEFGAHAAAATTAASSLLIMLLLILVTDKRVVLKNWLKLIISPIAASISMVAFCLLVASLVRGLILRTCVCVAGGAAVYCVVIVLLHNEIALEIMGKAATQLKGVRKGE